MSFVLESTLHNFPGSPLQPVSKFVDDPVGVQEHLLRDLLQRAADTEWGRRYNFGAIAGEDNVVEIYQEEVPLHTYDDIRDDVERLRKGASDVLWPGTFKHFAVSSGTVSSGKIIPVSSEMLRKNRAFSIAAGLKYLANTGQVDIFMGKHLTLPGRIEEDSDHPGTYIGEVSGLLAEKSPGWLRYGFQAIPNEVAFIDDWEQKLSTIVDRTIDQDIRLVVMAPTWGSTLFKRLIAKYNQTHERKVSTVGEIWPNLRVFISGGVALSSYRELLDDLIGLPDLDFVETYGASEGFFAFQSTLHDPAMLLHLNNGVFFEFVPLEEQKASNPSRHTIADIERDVRYAPYITSCSGLWSYELGDVVRFTQLDPPKILVVGRTSEMIDKYGEAVFGEEARNALQHACEKTGLHMRDFHVAPRAASNDRLPAHQWLVEFEETPPETAAFASSIDQYLQQANRHYRIRREADAFAPPEIVPLPKGTFYRWLQQTKDRISGQTKVPRLSEERTIADSVISLLNND
jgi:hypothetical protein